MGLASVRAAKGTYVLITKNSAPGRWSTPVTLAQILPMRAAAAEEKMLPINCDRLNADVRGGRM